MRASEAHVTFHFIAILPNAYRTQSITKTAVTPATDLMNISTNWKYVQYMEIVERVKQTYAKLVHVYRDSRNKDGGFVCTFANLTYCQHQHKHQRQR